MAGDHDIVVEIGPKAQKLQVLLRINSENNGKTRRSSVPHDVIVSILCGRVGLPDSGMDYEYWESALRPAGRLVIEVIR